MSQLFNQSPYTSNPNPGQIPGAANRPGGTNLPPPPPSASSELEVRTLQSDLEQMGGQANAFGNLTFSAPQIEVAMQMERVPGRTSASDVMPNRGYVTWLWIFIGLVAAGLLFAAGYFLLPKLTAKPQANPAGNNSSTTQSAQSLSTSTPPTFLGYRTFAKIPPDGKYDIVLTAGATGPSIVSSIIESVGQGNATSALGLFAEVVLKNPEGQALPWISYLKLVSANTVPDGIWQEHFEQGFNLYVRKDERSSWPVFVLKLKEGKSKLLADAEMAKLEQKSAELTKLYFFPPGEEMTEFEGKQVFGQPARVLTYGNPGARLVYGWIGDQYFLIGTSLEAFEEAGRRL